MASDLALLNAAHAKMKFLGQKQRVISQNIANSDTPNYRAKTLKEPDFGSVLEKTIDRASVRATTTHKNHIRPGVTSDGDARVVEKDEPREVTGNENSTSVEDQLMEAGKAMTEHKMMSNLYNKTMGMLMTSIGRGGGR